MDLKLLVEEEDIWARVVKNGRSICLRWHLERERNESREKRWSHTFPNGETSCCSAATCCPNLSFFSWNPPQYLSVPHFHLRERKRGGLERDTLTELPPLPLQLVLSLFSPGTNSPRLLCSATSVIGVCLLIAWVHSLPCFPFSGKSREAGEERERERAVEWSVKGFLYILYAGNGDFIFC